ncbi:MAG: hypothetical protein OXL97_04810 [Chloroflexota bacterium]|nr:hypothetical protein [Chloroflexota bacterium]MDE2884749.1 hypothetical protein [Chloroflexota bacterium]
MLEIRAPRHFDVPGRLFPRLARRYQDPRKDDFTPDEVVIDLRDCATLDPPAALWCVVYASLVRLKGIGCRVEPPDDAALCAELAAQGLFSMLEEMGVSVDARASGTANGSQIIMTLQRFSDVSEVEQLADDALECLSADKPVAGNLSALILNTFAELGNNAAEHAASPTGAFGMVQSYEPPSGGMQFWCTVADGGIGIRASLARNPALKPRYDRTAIEEALKELVTGTGSSHRGLGLFGIVEDMRPHGHEFIIHSGTGIMHLREEDSDPVAQQCPILFPGTLAGARISL